jgi:NAD(P)-dependent dehydrogenase (short-subunit alcohol dehydrogenase family)
MSKVWFITGAGRGMGVDIAKAALAAGHKVVATGRNTDKVAEALGKSANLLIVKLDITKPTDAEFAVKAAVDKFGRIDVLVNNAANFYAGFFEELTPEQMGAATDNEPYRPDERNPRRPAGYAQAAFRADYYDLINCGPYRL